MRKFLVENSRTLSYNIFRTNVRFLFYIGEALLMDDKYKQLIIDMVKKINDVELLKRIYNLVSYIYLNKADR